MRNNKKLIIAVVSAVVAVGAAVAAIIVFRKQIAELLANCPKPGFRPKEYDDYADVE